MVILKLIALWFTVGAFAYLLPLAFHIMFEHGTWEKVDIKYTLASALLGFYSAWIAVRQLYKIIERRNK